MSMQSLVGQSIRPPFGACDGGGLVAKPRIPYGACDGDGFTPKIGMPDGAMSFQGVRDMFVKKPAKNDASQATTPAMEAEQTKKKNNTAKFLTVAILLIGGAALGYGHRKHIEKGIDAVKGKFTELTSTGKAAEWMQKGKDLLAKAKDAIFVKAPQV